MRAAIIERTDCLELNVRALRDHRIGRLNRKGSEIGRIHGERRRAR